MSEQSSETTNEPSRHPRRRWWVRLIHPIGWTFWLVTIPVLLLAELWVVLFCPWVGDFRYQYAPDSLWGFFVAHSVVASPIDPSLKGVEGTVRLGPLAVGHYRAEMAWLFTRGFRSTTDPKTHWAGWTYGWGGPEEEPPEEALSLIWNPR
jgi:hypothetical protein